MSQSGFEAPKWTGEAKWNKQITYKANACCSKTFLFGFPMYMYCSWFRAAKWMKIYLYHSWITFLWHSFSQQPWRKKKMCVCLCVVWFLNFIIAAVQTFIISCYKIRNSLKHREAENSSISLAFVPGFKQSKLRMHVVFT